MSQSEHLHVIAVIDTDTTNAENLGIAVDGRTVNAFFRDKLPTKLRGRVHLTVLEGSAANYESIEQAFLSIGRVPNDSVLFYYSGHGGCDSYREKIVSSVRGLPLGVRVDGDDGHFLAMSHGYIWRSTIKKLIANTRARGRYVITDCCANFPSIAAADKGGARSVTSRPLGKLGTISNLRSDDRFEHAFEKFFLGRPGWVSMNACPVGNTASGTTAGGAYTNTLFKFIANGTLSSHPFANFGGDQWDADTIRYWGRWDLAHERIVGDHVIFGSSSIYPISANQFISVPDFARKQGYRGGVLFSPN